VLKINEIFFSIQGESSFAGYPTVFVRTSGCHLRCTYCDTQYAYYEGQKMTTTDIVKRVQAYPARHVCITGGEPLLSKEIYPLMSELCDLNYITSLETSGDLSCEHVDPRVRKVIDVKTPDSGAANKFCFDNLKSDPTTTEFKFVICSNDDFVWAERFAKENDLFEKFLVLYSPSFNVVEEIWLAQQILAAGSRARLQLQLHKYIWSPNARGI
jgi:7-carboxy-7-deazaguanine synthase